MDSNFRPQLYMCLNSVLGMWHGNTSENAEFDGSTPYMMDSVEWFAPTARPIAVWLNMAYIFPVQLWIMLLLTIISVLFIWITLEYNLHQTSPIYIGFRIIGSFLGNSFPNIKILRAFLMVWLFLTLMFNSFYQSNLISILTSPIYEEQIDNIYSARDKGYKYGYFVTIRTAVIADLTEKMKKYILDNEVICPLTPECVNRTAFDRDIIVAKGRRLTQYLMPRYYRDLKTGKDLLFQFENKKVFHYSVQALMVKGFPLLDKFNQVVGRLLNAGIVEKISADYDRVIMSNADTTGESDELKLTVAHLGIPFVILGLGYTIALIAFLGELKIHRVISVIEI